MCWCISATICVCVGVFQQQYAYVVIQALMGHLDTHTQSGPDIKAAIVDVLYESVLIAAGASVGRAIVSRSLFFTSLSYCLLTGKMYTQVFKLSSFEYVFKINRFYLAFKQVFQISINNVHIITWFHIHTEIVFSNLKMSVFQIRMFDVLIKTLD